VSGVWTGRDYRPNLTMRQLAPLFGVKTAAVHRIVDRLGPYLALAPARCRHGPDTALIVDGTLVPTWDHSVAAQSKNYRYSVNMQVLINAETRLVVAVGQPQPGNRNDCQAYTTSKIDRAAAGATVLADGGYPRTGLLLPHRRRAGQIRLPAWKEHVNTSHRRVRVEHTFAAIKDWKILRDRLLADTPDDDAASVGVSIGMAMGSVAEAVRSRHGGEDGRWRRTGSDPKVTVG
jgi:hypothetical protein